MTTKGYKAFDKGMTCQGFQFEEGKTYTHKGPVKCCPSQQDLDEGKGGFHFCEDPLDTLSYYDICTSEFAEVESDSGATLDTRGDDSKISTSSITIGAKLSLKGFIDAAISFAMKKCKKGDSSKQAASGDSSKQAASGNSSKQAASGYSSTQAASGDYSKQAASGDYSKQAASGDSSTLELTGKNSVAAGIGANCQARGKKGCWIVLAEWKDNKPICVRSGRIDGRKLKEDMWYKLINGEFME